MLAWQSRRGGFTLIELLVVIAIIGALASVVLSSLNSARTKGNTAKVQSDLRNMRSALALLESDTGKWPNGCAINQVVGGGSNEIAVTNVCSGLADTAPPSSGCACTWTAGEIASWSGPYFKTPLDPWGNSYQFDSDYYPREDCSTKDPSNPDNVAIVALFSNGPNGQGNGTNYDCDDIYRKIN